MSKILDRLFPSKKSVPKIYVAYAISICEYILNPSNQQIQVSESAIKFLIYKKRKLVSSDENEAETTSITATAVLVMERDIVHGLDVQNCPIHEHELCNVQNMSRTFY